MRRRRSQRPRPGPAHRCCEWGANRRRIGSSASCQSKRSLGHRLRHTNSLSVLGESAQNAHRARAELRCQKHWEKPWENHHGLPPPCRSMTAPLRWCPASAQRAPVPSWNHPSPQPAPSPFPSSWLQCPASPLCHSRSWIPSYSCRPSPRHPKPVACCRCWASGKAAETCRRRPAPRRWTRSFVHCPAAAGRAPADAPSLCEVAPWRSGLAWRHASTAKWRAS
mmetsp:Transcript_71337/g.157549  ORF Transcript_71337/g.157549 Transcript_71337/m.157549 type:complete len:223 (-) Transcript_71337:425-1093(-)